MVHAVPQGPVGPAAGAADELAALVQGEHVAADAGELPTDEVAVLATPGQVETEGVHEGGADDEQPQLIGQGLKASDLPDVGSAPPNGVDEVEGRAGGHAIGYPVRQNDRGGKAAAEGHRKGVKIQYGHYPSTSIWNASGMVIQSMKRSICLLQ